MTRARSFVLIVLSIFAIYVVITAPSATADIMRSAITQLGNALRSLGTFFTTLFGG